MGIQGGRVHRTPGSRVSAAGRLRVCRLLQELLAVGQRWWQEVLSVLGASCVSGRAVGVLSEFPQQS